MNLTDIFVYNKYLYDKPEKLIETSISHNVSVHIVKDLESIELEHLGSECMDSTSTLVFTDNEIGQAFALKNHIPYVGILCEHPCNEISPSFSKAICLTTDLCDITYEYALEQWSRAHGLPITIATKKRFTIRELTVSDVDALYQMYKNDKLTKCIPKLDDDIQAERDKQEAYIKYVYSFYGMGLWGVYLPDETLIGRVGIEPTELDDEPMIELSYLIDEPYQGKGYATECIEEVYKYCTNHLEINSLVAFIATNNLVSIKTAMKMGMKRLKECEYKGFSCYLYEIKDIKHFLDNYEQEKKRTMAATSAWDYAQKKPVQSVYKRVYRRNK